MKRQILTAVALFFFLASLVSVAEAGLFRSREETEKKVPGKLTKKEKDVVAVNSKSELKTKAWIVYLKPGDGAKLKGGTDIMSFGNNMMVTSKLLLGKGYEESQYGMRVHDNGTAIWETMQLHEDTKEPAFLQGNLKDGEMTGLIFIRPEEDPSETYYFSTIPYPGASGVGDALIATDRAAARARVHDSIAASH